jgi:hypothetical protein
MKRALVILPVVAIALYLFGGWMQRIHGLDPPYWVFFTGFFIQLASVGLAIISAMLLVIVCVRRAWQ